MWGVRRCVEYLYGAVVELVLQDGFTQVPEGVFRPQHRLEHQARVGRLAASGWDTTEELTWIFLTFNCDFKRQTCYHCSTVNLKSSKRWA